MSSVRSREGGHRDVKDVEPIVEILPEGALGHHLLQGTVGDGDDPHVDGDGFVSRPPGPPAAPGRTRRSLAWADRLRELISSNRITPPLANLEKAQLAAPRRAPVKAPPS